jgi:nitrate reductase delta subunit
MATTSTRYDDLAGLLAYPDATFRTRLALCRAEFGEFFPEAAELLLRFAQKTEGLSPEELEELYTQTFDLNPVCSLEVGWHLFGENYSRGEFLVTMRQLLRRDGLPESTELPDHLTHVLPVVARMGWQEADRFLVTYVLPALEKMLAGLGQKDSPYAYLLEAVRAALTGPCAAVTP